MVGSSVDPCDAGGFSFGEWSGDGGDVEGFSSAGTVRNQDWSTGNAAIPAKIIVTRVIQNKGVVVQ